VGHGPVAILGNGSLSQPRPYGRLELRVPADVLSDLRPRQPLGLQPGAPPHGGFVYEHADALGAIRLGTGPRARLGLDLVRARGEVALADYVSERCGERS
jgi:hypothetical protein